MDFTNKPMIVIIGGTSSSGKTSTARALQIALAQQNKPFVHLPIDEFVSLLPDSWFNPDASKNIAVNPEGIQLVRADDEQGPKVVVRVGTTGMKLIQAYMPVVATIASYGSHVIIDGVFSTPYMQEAAKHLNQFRVYCVGIRCPLEITEQREQTRGALGGFVGLSRGHSQEGDAHKHDHYDLLIDTSFITPDQAAEKIIEYMTTEPNPQALQLLYKDSISN